MALVLRRLLVILGLGVAAVTHAEQGPAEVTAPAPSQPAQPPAPPVSLPWSLRSIAPADIVRSDSSAAFFQDAKGNPGSTGVSFVYASKKLTPSFLTWVKAGFVGNDPPGSAGSTASFVNPAVGLSAFLTPIGGFRAAAMVGLALPVGMGGGNSPSPSVLAADKAGVIARSSMDNAMFAVNDTVMIPGVDVAFVRWGLTLQAEATFLFLVRTRGAEAQPDAVKINMTTGVHAGYFVTSWLSLGTEFRYQRWLLPPKAVTAATLAQASLAIGPRFTFKVGSATLKPGISYAFGFDAPMSTGHYSVVQLDLPIAL